MMDEATRRQIEFTAAWHQQDAAHYSGLAMAHHFKGSHFYAIVHQRNAARAAQHAMMDLMALIDGRTW